MPQNVLPGAKPFIIVRCGGGRGACASWRAAERLAARHTVLDTIILCSVGALRCGGLCVAAGIGHCGRVAARWLGGGWLIELRTSCTRAVASFADEESAPMLSIRFDMAACRFWISCSLLMARLARLMNAASSMLLGMVFDCLFLLTVLLVSNGLLK